MGAGFSVPHIHRIFTVHVGESISSYVRRVRMERAGRKLRMGAVAICQMAYIRTGVAQVSADQSRRERHE